MVICTCTVRNRHEGGYGKNAAHAMLEEVAVVQVSQEEGGGARPSRVLRVARELKTAALAVLGAVGAFS